MAVELVMDSVAEYAKPGDTLFLVHGGGVALTPQVIPFQGKRESLTWTPCTPIDGNRVAWPVKLLGFRNVGTVAHTVTLYGAITPAGREDDLVISIPAGQYALAYPADSAAFRQMDDYLYFEADSEEVEAVALTFEN